MNKVLVPIEAGHPERLRSAVDQVVRLHRQGATQVYLLHVQKRVSGHVSSYFDPDALHNVLVDWGQESLEPAHRMLEAAGVPHNSIVRVGQSAPTIAAVARELGCSHIVFGAETPGLAERFFGSMAQQVKHHFQAQGDPQIIGS